MATARVTYRAMEVLTAVPAAPPPGDLDDATPAEQEELIKLFADVWGKEPSLVGPAELRSSDFDLSRRRYDIHRRTRGAMDTVNQKFPNATEDLPVFHPNRGFFPAGTVLPANISEAEMKRMRVKEPFLRVDSKTFVFPRSGVVRILRSAGRLFDASFPWHLNGMFYRYGNKHLTAIPMLWESRAQYLEALPQLWRYEERISGYQRDTALEEVAEIIPRTDEVLRSLRQQFAHFPEVGIYGIVPTHLRYHGGHQSTQSPSQFGSRTIPYMDDLHTSSGVARLLEDLRKWAAYKADKGIGVGDQATKYTLANLAMRLSTCSLLYEGPAWKVGIVVARKHVLPGDVWVTPEGTFICSSWCQREHGRYLDGASQIAHQNLSLSQWFGSHGIQKLGLTPNECQALGFMMPVRLVPQDRPFIFTEPQAVALSQLGQIALALPKQAALEGGSIYGTGPTQRLQARTRLCKGWILTPVQSDTRSALRWIDISVGLERPLDSSDGYYFPPTIRLYILGPIEVDGRTIGTHVEVRGRLCTPGSTYHSYVQEIPEEINAVLRTLIAPKEPEQRNTPPFTLVQTAPEAAPAEAAS